MTIWYAPIKTTHSFGREKKSPTVHATEATVQRKITLKCNLETSKKILCNSDQLKTLYAIKVQHVKTTWKLITTKSSYVPLFMEKVWGIKKFTC